MQTTSSPTTPTSWSPPLPSRAAMPSATCTGGPGQTIWSLDAQADRPTHSDPECKYDHPAGISYPGSSWFPASGIYGMHWHAWMCDCGNNCPTSPPLQIAPPPKRAEAGVVIKGVNGSEPDGFISLSTLPGWQGDVETLSWASNTCCKSLLARGSRTCADSLMFRQPSKLDAQHRASC